MLKRLIGIHSSYNHPSFTVHSSIIRKQKNRILLKIQGEFSGIKLYKFSTLMINARMPTPFECPNALNFE